MQQYITHHILKQSSSGTAVRRKKLLTMASQRSTKKKTKHDRENETVIKCLRRRLAWCERNGQPFSFDDELYQYFLEHFLMKMECLISQQKVIGLTN